MPEEPNTDEAADPSTDLKQQNTGGATTADLVDEDDPHKAEKLTSQSVDGDVGEAEE